MVVLGLDLETTGLDPVTDRVIEAGLVLWDTDIKTPVRVEGFLINCGIDIPVLITEITGITRTLCETWGKKEPAALRFINSCIGAADYVCAHNGNKFDKKFLFEWSLRENFVLQDKLWIDTNTDLPLPPKASHKLTHMAAEHGFLNPFPHRAVFDVMTMMILLDKYPLEEILTLARSPLVILQALVEYEDKDLAKARGYKWQPRMKLWTMEIKECFLEQEREEAGFPTKVIQGPVE